MADVIVIGGGLTGLAAAWELEKRGVGYTLIEVKGRLGGSIISEKRDGFVLDGGPMVLYRTQDWPFLKELDLDDWLYRVAEVPGGELVAFKYGTQMLTDALAKRLQNGRTLTRMAVSSIGKVENRYAVCLENGLMLEAAGLVVTAPARFAERMFYAFQPEISARLLKFPYDNITRVSLGYRAEDITLPIVPPPDAAYAFGRWTDSSYRTPPGHVLLQIGVRYKPLPDTPPETIVREVARSMRWPLEPVLSRVDFWSESHSLAPHTPQHDQMMTEIEQHLPDGIALAGNDYCAARFEDRVLHGQAAAQKIVSWLQA